MWKLWFVGIKHLPARPPSLFVLHPFNPPSFPQQLICFTHSFFCRHATFIHYRAHGASRRRRRPAHKPARPPVQRRRQKGLCALHGPSPSPTLHVQPLTTPQLGLTSGQTREQWRQDIQDAKAAGIDAFILNAGPTDNYSDEQLDIAYTEAAAETGFSLAISFDMNPDLVDAWTVEHVAGWINKFAASPAQLKVDGKSFVSTFEGPSWIDNWGAVRDQTGGIYLVPDFSSIGVPGLAEQGYLEKMDGAFSWDAWAKDGGKKTTDADIGYTDMLAGTGKSYMMGVSPSFFTDIDFYNKNWLWSSDTLWFDRWEQVLEIAPAFVEVITWNDYGESHYIGSSPPPVGGPEIADVHRYVDGVPHGALRDVLPWYIASYKAGQKLPVEEDVAVFWYRQNPKAIGDRSGVMCKVGETLVDPSECVEDAVFVLVLAKEDGNVKVEIGEYSEEIPVKAGSQLVSLQFAGRTGDVRVTLAGQTGQGPTPITNEAPATGHNFNYFTGSTKQ